MVISNSQVNMGSKRLYTSSTYAHTSYTSWDGSQVKRLDLTDQSFRKNSDSYESGNGMNFDDSNYGNMNFSDSMEDMYEKQMRGISVSDNLIEKRNQSAKMLFLSLNYLLHWLFGKHYSSDSEWENTMSEALSDQQLPGGSYSFQGYRSETEITTYSTTGTVQTADGRSIDFNLNLSMTRAFEEQYTEAANWGAALNAAALCDPLVINLDSASATVTDQSFLFDIDSDGKSDEISMPTGGSGFLAIDKNGDGVIGDGSELFGTQSGNGFADLKAYDEDNNGWIDETDSVFKRLMIYSKGSDGSDKLVSIGEAGVGAIYLGSSQTDFSLTGNNGDTNAVIRKTGVFLFENGSAGTIQHVDIAKKDA
ncbi:MAG: hypothetical protein K6E13_11075 [Lachnospiraceae bacterium]|nr:hypothetical protein [Lachnospiraceae bacterium]